MGFGAGAGSGRGCSPRRRAPPAARSPPRSAWPPSGRACAPARAGSAPAGSPPRPLGPRPARPRKTPQRSARAKARGRRGPEAWPRGPPSGLLGAPGVSGRPWRPLPGGSGGGTPRAQPQRLGHPRGHGTFPGFTVAGRASAALLGASTRASRHLGTGQGPDGRCPRIDAPCGLGPGVLSIRVCARSAAECRQKGRSPRPPTLPQLAPTSCPFP